jgi:hypothetical protein
MKLRILTFLAVLLTACAETGPRDVTTLLEQGDVLLDPETMTPYSGPIFQPFREAPERPRWSGELREGLRVGPFQFFYASGVVESRGAYAAGLREGDWEFYHRDGSLRLKGPYLDGQREGRWETFGEGGELSERGTYHRGERCGAWSEAGETRAYDSCPTDSDLMN